MTSHEPSLEEWLEPGADFVARRVDTWEFTDDPDLADVLATARERNRELHQVVTSLAELRRAVGVTQVALAAAWDRSQPQVSRLEANPTTGELATIAGYITALGGHMTIEATFDDHTYRVDIA